MSPLDIVLSSTVTTPSIKDASERMEKARMDMHQMRKRMDDAKGEFECARLLLVLALKQAGWSDVTILGAVK